MPQPELGRPSKAKYYHVRVIRPTKFDPESFRIIDPGRVGMTKLTIACPKGQWSRIKKRCKVGTQVQAILVEKRRPGTRAALAAAKKRAGKVQSRAARRRGKSNNPLLMLMHNPGLPPEIENDPDFKKAVKAYKKFHGVEPASVSRVVLKTGGKRVTERTFAYTVGEAPDVTYRTRNKKSSKAGKTYIHEYESPPEKVFIPKIGAFMDLPGDFTVDDWVRG